MSTFLVLLRSMENHTLFDMWVLVLLHSLALGPQRKRVETLFRTKVAAGSISSDLLRRAVLYKQRVLEQLCCKRSHLHQILRICSESHFDSDNFFWGGGGVFFYRFRFFPSLLALYQQLMTPLPLGTGSAPSSVGVFDSSSRVQLSARSFASAMFRGFSSVYHRQELLGCIIAFIGSPNVGNLCLFPHFSFHGVTLGRQIPTDSLSRVQALESSCALATLLQLAACQTNALLRFATLMQGLLDYLEELPFHQVKDLYR